MSKNIEQKQKSKLLLLTFVLQKLFFTKLYLLTGSQIIAIFK